MPEHPGIELDLLRPGDLDARGGRLQRGQGVAEDPEARGGTAARTVISGMMPSEMVGTAIISSSRPSCPAWISAVPNQVRRACSSSTTSNRLPGAKMTFCRSMRVGFQNSATGPDLDFYVARSYSLMRPPRTGRRWIRFRERSATG